MSAYNQEFNKDNVVLRYIIVAMLAELKDKVYYYNTITDEEGCEGRKKIEIPFYYSVTGNGRFLLDNFLYDAEASGKAVGDYEVVPRGVVQLSSMAIESSALTNKFVRSELVKEIDGQLKTFSFMTAFLPVKIGMECTIVCSNNLEMLKATEAIISKLYKAQTFSVDLGMVKVQGGMQIPEDYSQERLFEYALNDKKEYKVTFSIDVDSFIPVFEGGISLAEIQCMVEGSTGEGIGVYRNGGIYFGNVMEEIDSTIDNIKKEPISKLYSNQGYNDPNKINTGPTYNERNINSEPIDHEDSESKDYRNAGGKEDPGAQDDLTDK